MNVAAFFLQLTGSRRLRNIAGRIEAAAAQATATVVLWHERGRQRRALGRLDAALLHDIGRSRQEVAHECAKPIWRA